MRKLELGFTLGWGLWVAWFHGAAIAERKNSIALPQAMRRMTQFTTLLIHFPPFSILFEWHAR